MRKTVKIIHIVYEIVEIVATQGLLVVQKKKKQPVSKLAMVCI